jgi:hypothetical protein
MYSTMTGDSPLVASATGGVWQGYANTSIIAPIALYTQQSGVDKLTLNAVRLWSSMKMQIKAVGPASQYAALVTIADRIDALFGSVRNVTLASGGVLDCYREQSIAYEELVNGQQWSHLGGIYCIDLQKS